MTEKRGKSLMLKVEWCNNAIGKLWQPQSAMKWPAMKALKLWCQDMEKH